MIKVALYGARFFSYHGFYPEEQILGNHFIVDISVEFTQQHHFDNDNISCTVNYEQLYQIVSDEMSCTRKLLETVVQGIIDHIKGRFPFVETIQASIKKLNPPLPGNVACSHIQITYSKPHDDQQNN